MAIVVNMVPFENNKGDKHVGIFRFNIEDMNKLEHYYLSEDVYKINGLQWICSVKRFQDGEFQVAIELPPSANPLLRSCVLDFNITLLNSNSAKNATLLYESRRQFKVGRKHMGQAGVIDWNVLNDPRQGFVDSY